MAASGTRNQSTKTRCFARISLRLRSFTSSTLSDDLTKSGTPQGDGEGVQHEGEARNRLVHAKSPRAFAVVYFLA